MGNLLKCRMSATEREYVRRINLVIEYIEENLSQEISLDILAKKAFFSAFHFHRIFSACLGESPADYVRRARLERAANRLIHNHYESMTEIAFSSGFSSSSLFSRLFKQHFGMAPQAWRKNGNTNSKKNKMNSKNRKASPVLFRYSYKGSNKYLERRRKMLKNVKVEVKTLPEIKVAYVLHMNGYEDGEGIKNAYEKICAWAGPRGFMSAGTRLIGISPDNPDVTPKNKCRHCACIEVVEDVKSEGEVGVRKISAGTYAIGHFEGKDDIFKKAYEYMYGLWLPENGYQPENCPAFEQYTMSPQDHPRGYFVFDLCVPIKPL